MRVIGGRYEGESKMLKDALSGPVGYGIQSCGGRPAEADLKAWLSGY